MACFLLRDPDGNERWMPEQTAYFPRVGEYIVPGMIRWHCGPNPVHMAPVKFRKCSNCGELGVYEST